jgi:hypothetical protein
MRNKRGEKRRRPSFLHLLIWKNRFWRALEKESRVFGNPSFISGFGVATIHPSQI